MTDPDNIELPPLPNIGLVTELIEWVKDQQRDAVLADRERRAEPAKPKTRSVVMKLQSDGCAWRDTEKSWWTPSMVAATVILRWTDDGRAWIESEKNRGLATRLRYYASTLQPEGFRWRDFSDAADTLDGGVR